MLDKPIGQFENFNCTKSVLQSLTLHIVDVTKPDKGILLTEITTEEARCSVPLILEKIRHTLVWETLTHLSVQVPDLHPF